MLVEVIAVTSVGAVAAAKFRSWGLAAVVMIGAGTMVKWQVLDQINTGSDRAFYDCLWIYPKRTSK